MSLDQRCIRRRMLYSWIGTILIGTTTAGTLPTAQADDFDTFLNAANAFHVDELPQMNVEVAKAPAAESLGTVDTEDSEGLDTPEVDDDDEDLLGDLSKKIDDFEEDMSALEESLDKVEDLAGNKSIVVSGTSKSTMKISGRVHLDAWGFDTDDDPAINDFNGGDDPANRLGFRRLRFGVKGKITDNMIYKIEMEFANGNDAEFRDAFIGWTNLPWLQEVLLGNQKRPFGLDHLNSSRYNVFIERPYVIEAFNEDARRLGLQSYGISDDLAWNWRYGVFNQRNVQDDGNYTGDHLQLQIAGRLANTAWYDETSGGRGYAHWAISGAHADVSRADDGTDGQTESRFRTRPEGRTAGDRWLDTGLIPGADFYNLIGLESVVNLGALQLVGEYQSNWVERDGGFSDARLDGGYLYASYFLTGEHIPWDRESGTIGRVIPFENFWMVDRMKGGRAAGWGALQIAARYSYIDLNDGIPDSGVFGGEGESFTFGLNWHWNANARMQFNYITGTISNRDADNGDNTQTAVNATPDVQTGDYNIYGARFMVDF